MARRARRKAKRRVAKRRAAKKVVKKARRKKAKKARAEIRCPNCKKIIKVQVQEFPKVTGGALGFSKFK